MTIEDPLRYRNTARMFQQRYGIRGQLPKIDLLKKVLVHFSKLPYENISKIIKLHYHFETPDRIRLPDEVLSDHFEFNLGGTCFSLSYFLYSILVNSGFKVYPVMADMQWGRNVHCALVVLLDGKKFLIDPGYLLSEPFEIDENHSKIYHSEISGVELVCQSKNLYNLYTFNKNQRKWRYRFHDIPVSMDDFLKYWHASFYWNSMNGICLTKIEKNRMIYIHKTFMRETWFDYKKNTNIKQTIHETIQQNFGIDPRLVEEALTAVEDNKQIKRELGLWTPKKKSSDNDHS